MGSMPFAIHGLKVASDSEPGCDVTWKQQCVARLTPALHSGVALESRLDGVWTHQIFNDVVSGITACRFSTSPDGRQVVLHSRDWADESELLDVFSEPVMRTVLFRQGLISFHAAALVKDDQAILLMGHKGSGKSSLAAALLEHGWWVLADDLVRLAEVRGRWYAHSGRNQVKLNADVALALGHHPTAMKRRWADSVAESAGNKCILETAAPPLRVGGYPVRIIFALAARDAARTGVAVTIPPSSDQARLLVVNATPDPGGHGKPPPAGFSAAASALLTQCQFRTLGLPDKLSELPSAALAIDALVSQGLRRPRAHWCAV